MHHRYGRATEPCKTRSGAQLWRSDGTERGTFRVDDTEDVARTAAGAAPRYLTAFNGYIFYQVR